MPRSGPRTTNKYSDGFKAAAVRVSELPGVEVRDAIAFTSERRAKSSSSSKRTNKASRSE